MDVAKDIARQYGIWMGNVETSPVEKAVWDEVHTSAFQGLRHVVEDRAVAFAGGYEACHKDYFELVEELRASLADAAARLNKTVDVSVIDGYDEVIETADRILNDWAIKGESHADD